MSHKTSDFYIITLAFLGRFYTFVGYQWKQEGILYKGSLTKFYHFTLTVFPHYLVKLKRHNKQHILKSIITLCSIEPVVRNFRKKSSNVHLFILVRKFCYQSILYTVKKFHTPIGFCKKFGPIFKCI